MRIKWLRDIAVRLGLAGAVALTLAACGAVTGSGTPAVGGDLLVLPAVADLFPDVPAQFSISGGKPGYSVFSSNSVVLPLDSAVIGTTFFATPRSVPSDTPVTITVRDADGKTNAATVTVKPAVINNSVIFTIVTPTGSGCGANALCSGDTAQVRVTASLNGTVLVNRPIRFAVFLGDFLFVTPGTGELVNSITINTDEHGEAVIRLTAAVGAPAQVATLTSTDVTSGLVRRFSFNIVPRTLSALPSGDTTFTGDKGPVGGGAGSGLCPFGGLVDYYIFGGTPPYRVASPLPQLVLLSVSGSAFAPEVIVTSNGGSVTASLSGCGQTQLLVTDATSRSIETSQIIGVRGPNGDAAPAVPAAVPATVNPDTITLNTCGEAVTVVLGGTSPILSTIATAGGGALISVANGATSATITRRITPPAPGPAGPPMLILVNFSNSAGTATLTVNLAGPAQGACPP